MKSIATIKHLCLLALIIPVNAFSSHAESMNELRERVDFYENRGYECRSSALNGTGYLAEGKSYTVKTTLYEDFDYILLAAGNSHTKDLDVKLYDENFRKVAEDDDDDNLPLVRTSPRQDGDYYIKVTMYEGKGYSDVVACYK